MFKQILVIDTFNISSGSPHVIVILPHFGEVNIDSDTGLAPPGYMPVPGPMLTISKANKGVFI